MYSFVDLVSVYNVISTMGKRYTTYIDLNANQFIEFIEAWIAEMCTVEVGVVEALIVNWQFHRADTLLAHVWNGFIVDI